MRMWAPERRARHAPPAAKVVRHSTARAAALPVKPAIHPVIKCLKNTSICASEKMKNDSFLI